MLLNSIISHLRTPHGLIFFRITLDIVYLFCQFCLKCYFSVHCRLKATFKPWANSFIIYTFMSIVEMLHIYCDVYGYIFIYAFVCYISIWFAGETLSKPGSYAKHYVHLNIIRHFKLFSSYFPTVKI